ncbi:MAG: hypothetical protein R3F46_01650 [bacterium]
MDEVPAKHDGPSVLRTNSAESFIDFLTCSVAEFNDQYPPANASWLTRYRFRKRDSRRFHEDNFQTFFIGDFIDRVLAFACECYCYSPEESFEDQAPRGESIGWEALANLIQAGKYYNYGITDTRTFHPGVIREDLDDNEGSYRYTRFLEYLCEHMLLAQERNPWKLGTAPLHCLDPGREWTWDRFLGSLENAIKIRVGNGQLAADSPGISFDQLTEILREVIWWDGTSAKSK